MSGAHVIGWSSVRGADAVFAHAYVTDGMLVRSAGGWYWGPAIMATGSIIPTDNAAYMNGWGVRYDWGGYGKHQWNAWWGVVGYNFWSVSSQEEKKGIKDLGEDDYENVLRKVREVRSVYYWFNQEHSTMEESRAAAMAKIEEMVQKGEIKTEEQKRKNLEVFEAQYYRPVPHLGVLAESLPSELHPNGVSPYMYSLTDMDGFLLAAIKALDKKLQDREQRLIDLEERVAFLEQLLVDQGILK
jgi:hypothetical protein